MSAGPIGCVQLFVLDLRLQKGYMLMQIACVCAQNMLSEKDKVVTALKKEIEKLKEELAAKESAPPENSGTKVVVVTPKITVSMPDGSMRDHGKMGLPKHVLQVRVA
jgi:hypothetical protein